ELSESWPLDSSGAIRLMTGYERDRRRMCAMRDRDARVRRAGNRAGDSRDDLYRHARGDELLRLFATAAEHEGIAAFEPHDVASRLRLIDEKLVDLVLRQRVRRGALADVNDLGGFRD